MTWHDHDRPRLRGRTGRDCCARRDGAVMLLWLRRPPRATRAAPTRSVRRDPPPHRRHALALLQPGALAPGNAFTAQLRAVRPRTAPSPTPAPSTTPDTKR